MKPKQTGHIVICGQLVAVELVKVLASGKRTVRLVDDFRAYRAGDKVTVGTGEFIKDELKDYQVEVIKSVRPGCFTVPSGLGKGDK